MTFRFTGNQVRLLGMVGPDGGWADAFRGWCEAADADRVLESRRAT